MKVNKIKEKIHILKLEGCEWRMNGNKRINKDGLCEGEVRCNYCTIMKQVEDILNE